jgi:DNA phosphorothioation-dependent restriction protein DptG
MIPKLRQAFEKIESLPEQEQEELAARLMEIMDSEEREWDALLSRPDVFAALTKLGEEALEEFQRGETLPPDCKSQ